MHKVLTVTILHTCASLCKKARASGPRTHLVCLQEANARTRYFCQVRFLWRLDRKRLRRLCFDILRRRFFFRLPMAQNGRPCVPVFSL